MKSIKVALIGQPNVGKSTLFSSLTGIHQYVTNYPGATVEFAEQKVKYKNRLFKFIDFPGTYSINSFDKNERLTLDLINKNKPDIIINIINSTSLEQNLYLTTQLMELGIPLVLFLNMRDVAESKGIFIDCNLLSEKIGIPVISGIAKKKTGIDELFEELIKSYDTKRQPVSMPYSPEAEAKIKNMTENDSSEILLLKERYRFLGEIASQCVRREKVEKRYITPIIDSIFLNRFAALPLFFLSIYIIFQMVFLLGAPMIQWIDGLFAYMSASVNSLWQEGSDSLLRSLIVDGIIAGTGGVLAFTPNVFLLFLGLAVLEASGYMTRVAVIMDRYMSKIGLSGKSIIPMVVGFGCNVPAIMSTRIIENKRERFATILAIPFMSCSARLPVYVLLISIFIEDKYKALILLLIYLIGIAVAMIIAKTFRSTFFRGDGNPLIIELPDYSLPGVKGVLFQTWDNGKHYISKAGTVILAASVILWVLTSFPRNSSSDTPDAGPKVFHIENSYMGHIGRAIEPGVKLMGGDWRVGSALISSLAAKEIFISQLGILFSLSDASGSDGTLEERVKGTYTLPAILSFIIFMLLSAPCVATFAIIKSETGAWRWSIFQFVFMTIIAFTVSVIVFQVGSIIMPGS